MDSSNPSSRWRKPALIGVLVVFVLPLILVFTALFDRNHPMMRTTFTERGGMLYGDDSRVSRSKMMGQAIVGESGIAVPTPMMWKGVPAVSSPTIEPALPSERKVASTASLQVRVENIDWTIGKIREIVAARGGYVENMSANQPKFGEHTAWVTLKVPSQDVQATLTELKGSLSSVVSESFAGVDVTDISIDLAARLKNKQAEESSLQDLLGRAVKVSDVIEITDRLTQVRSEIESLQAQIRQLSSQTDMASITISLTEDPRVTADTNSFRSGNVFKKALSELIKGLVQTGSGLVIILVAGIPIVAVYIGILWIIYFFTKKGVNRFFDR